MADSFQPDFYVACATVIPVLFLAAAVEGRVYRWVLSTSEQADRYAITTMSATPGLEPPAWWARGLRWANAQLASYASVALLLIAILIVLAGGFGEGLALFVLSQKSDTTTERTAVLVFTLALVGAVLAGPVVALARSLWSLVLGPMYAPYWRTAVRYWRGYVQLWRRWRAAQSWQETLHLFWWALRYFPGDAAGQSTASAESRVSSIRPYYYDA